MSRARTWVNRSYRLIAVVVLLAGAASGALLAEQWDQAQQRSDTAADRRQARAVVSRLQVGFEGYQRALGAERALYAASGGQVSASRFREFVTGLDLAANYPGLQDLTFRAAVPGQRWESGAEAVLGAYLDQAADSGEITLTGKVWRPTRSAVR